MIYVKLDDVSDKDLEFFGYEFVHEGEKWKLYVQRSTGEEHKVNKAKPRLYIDDINDARALGRDIIRVQQQ